jgi:hypothetical protein
MKRKQFIIIFGALGFIFLLCWLAVIVLAIKNLRGLTNKSADPVMVDVTLCDVDAKNLCIVNFGANNLNRMVINFQLPGADYPAFYVKAANRDIVSVYTCEVDKPKVVNETEAEGENKLDEPLVDETMVPETEVAKTETAKTEIAKATPTSAHCTGARTPLGETIDIEVYTTDEDKLIAHGTFLVSAIALSTPMISETTITTSGEERPTFYPSPTSDIIPTSTQDPFLIPSEPTYTPTATPDIAYP